MRPSPTSDYSYKFDFINPTTTPIVMPVKTNSPVPHQVARPMSTFSPTPPIVPDHMLTFSPPMYNVPDPVPLRSPMVNSNGYIPNDIPRSGYLPQDEAFAVRSTWMPSPAGTPEESQVKVPVVASLTDNRGISGTNVKCGSL